MPSSVIAEIKYDPATLTLRITFTSGSVYDYQNVPGDTYQNLKASGAKGNFLNEHIKGVYEFKKIR